MNKLKNSPISGKPILKSFEMMSMVPVIKIKPFFLSIVNRELTNTLGLRAIKIRGLGIFIIFLAGTILRWELQILHKKFSIFTIFFTIVRDNRVDTIRFDGDLSIVTTGSAEIPCENITDMTIDEIFAMTGDDILAMTEIEVTNRRKLALILPLLSLRNALHTYLCDGVRDDFGTLLEL